MYSFQANKYNKSLFCPIVTITTSTRLVTKMFKVRRNHLFVSDTLDVTIEAEYKRHVTRYMKRQVDRYAKRQIVRYTKRQVGRWYCDKNEWEVNPGEARMVQEGVGTRWGRLQEPERYRNR